MNTKSTSIDTTEITKACEARLMDSIVNPSTIVSRLIKSHERLLEALYYTLDLFSRPNIPFFLLDETARSVRDNTLLSGDKIVVGIRSLEAQERSFSILKAFAGEPEEITQTHIKYTHEGVPILIKILKDNGNMFISTDVVHYKYEAWNIPNPFEEYWKTRELY